MFDRQETVSTVWAAALSGKAPQTIRARIADGKLRATGGVVMRIDLRSLETWMDRELTHEDFARACQRLEPRRERERHHNHRRLFGRPSSPPERPGDTATPTSPASTTALGQHNRAMHHAMETSSYGRDPDLGSGR